MIFHLIKLGKDAIKNEEFINLYISMMKLF